MSKLLELREAFNALIESLRAKRDSMGSSNVVSIRGPSTVKQGDTVTWEISNFDVASSYSVSSNLGTASISEKTITYKHNIGDSTFSPFDLSIVCNGVKRTIQVPIQEVGIERPRLTSISYSFVNNNYVLVLTSSAFAVKPVGSSTHTATDWEIASDSAFTNVVWSSLNDATNKLSITTGELAPSTTFYLRLRYRGTNQIPSRWYTTPISTVNQAQTSYSTGFITSYSAGTLKTTSHSTSWMTEAVTAKYTVAEHLTSGTTQVSELVDNQWQSVNKSTSWITSRVSSVFSNTQWSTGGTTSYQTGSDYDQSTSQTTTWTTSSLTSATTSWNTSHGTSHVTSYSTGDSHVTTAPTNWTTSHGTSHVTSYTTGGSRTTSVTTSWNSVSTRTTTWTTSWLYTEWIKGWYPPDDPVNGYYGTFPYTFSTSVVTSITISESTPMSRTTSWTTSDAQTTGHTTSYTTSYSTGQDTSWTTSDAQTTGHTTSYTTTYGTSQPTSWTTSYNTSASTTWITDVRITSKYTSNSTSKLTDV